tara:strand:+ start:417 stop:1205 length:789 start_codon:yes stop_codon:yes gene_type:complete
MFDFNKILPDLIDLSSNASSSIMEIYNSDFSHKNKDDGSPLTLADESSNNIIIEGLKIITPEIQIVSEETFKNNISYEKSYWLIDPLDGTKEFINRNGDFSVNISFIHEKRSIFGIVQRPTDLRTWTSLDKVSHEKLEDTSPLRIVMSRSHKRESDTMFLQFLQDSEIDYEVVEKGSSLKICALCDDEADIYPRFGPTSEWDIAAADAVLESYGGSIFSLEDFEKLKYSKKNILNPPFIAYKNELIKEAYSQKVEDYVKKLL